MIACTFLYGQNMNIRNKNVCAHNTYNTHINYLEALCHSYKASVSTLLVPTNNRFGPGPHIVEFDVIFSGAEADEEPSKFAVEMAPLDLMPHSVLLFLEMVEKQLWDETAFVHHTHHIVSATPTIYHTGISKRSEFDKEGLAHVAFQEYTEEYPHDVYTLGFSGRPGGPDFYISTMDNSQMHGPGGQMDAELIEEADPCFAKVIRGFDIVDRIYQKGVVAPLDIHVVGIVSAAITER